ncbi:hypothetical protein [Halomontanus rarus]|uniref:hypothetical protein n=1 Tax=Halomontanus rarus TaxID=3034020 RepID=UPI0023E84ABD|nr:hypothetical protein [Halovivax sp. TS33]
MSKDVLIYADERTVEHKLESEVPDGNQCFWTVSGTPRQTDAGCEVLFSDGDRVHARGEVVDVTRGRIWFTPLEKCDDDLPCEPVTRGFKYVR